MTIIKKYLIEIIKSNGPISIEEFTKIAMNNYRESYYVDNLAIGKKGDFVTAPEISQLFGEAIILALIIMWEKLAKPKKFDLLEFGPGTGILMQDIIRIAKKFPEFYQAINVINLIETNVKLENIQKQNLSSIDKSLFWYKDFREINFDNMIFFVANEFFDALPIRQYIKRENNWYEIMVNFLPEKDLFFDYRPLTDREIIFDEDENIQDGDIIEIHNITNEIFRYICDHIKNYGGGMILIDYGYNRNFALPNSHYISSLQSVKSHKYNPVLENIGQADISSMVDFGSLIKIAQMRDLKYISYLTQRDFLLKYNIRENMQHLAKKASKIQSEEMMIAYDRLVNPTKMGNIFKTIEISHI